MKKTILAAAITLSTLTSLPVHADFLHFTPSETSVIVSVLSVVAPFYLSGQGLDAVSNALTKMSETKTPMQITKIEDVNETEQRVEANFDGKIIEFKAKGNGLKRNNVQVGDQIYAKSTKTGYVLEKNNIVVAIIAGDLKSFDRTKIQ